MCGIMIRTPGGLALVAAALLVLAADPALSTAPAGDGGPINRRGTYAGGRYVIEVDIHPPPRQSSATALSLQARS
jgi:hypothetical protein